MANVATGLDGGMTPSGGGIVGCRVAIGRAAVGEAHALADVIGRAAHGTQVDSGTYARTRQNGRRQSVRKALAVVDVRVAIKRRRRACRDGTGSDFMDGGSAQGETAKRQKNGRGEEDVCYNVEGGRVEGRGEHVRNLGSRRISMA